MSEKVLNGARAAEFWEAAKRALSAKQDTLTGRPGQVVGFDASGAAAAVEGWSGWNFADNGGFDIWRNGTALDADGWMCTADRWNNDSQKCRYERVDNPFPDCQCRYAMKVTNLADGQWASICQTIEPDLAAALDGRTVTLSVWVMGQSDQKFGISAGTVSEGRVFSLSDQPQRVSVTGVFRDQADKSLNRILTLIDGPAGAKAGDWYIAAGLKLELGDAATPYTPRGMPLEYAVCSQYSPITGEWDGFRHSNPNLLDNWYLVDPINQMGQTVYTGAGYTIDRWRHDTNGAAVSITPNGLVFSGLVDPDARYFSQFIDIPAEWFAGKTLTGSIMIDGQLFCGTVTVKEQYDDWGGEVFAEGGHFRFYFQKTPVNESYGGYFRAIFDYTQETVENHAAFQAVKLELGPVQTLAHQDADGNWVLNDPPPNKALELAKCQRYMLVLPNYGTLFAGVGIGAAYGTDKVKYIVPTPVSMRIVPSVAISGLWVAQGNGKSIAIPSSARFVAYEMSANAIGLCMENCPSSFVLNQLYKLETNNDPTAKIIFDANL